MGKKKQTIGYRYFMSLLSGLCRGPVDELRMIKVGGELAWDGNLCSDDVQFIDEPDLFGGEKKEGGIKGPFRIFMGRPDQVLPGAASGLPSVKASIGGNVSEFRNVVTLWYDGLVSCMNPYLKEWSFRVRRTRKGWHGGVPWYPEKAAIYLSGDFMSLNKSGEHFQISLSDNFGTIKMNHRGTAGESVSINGKKFELTSSSSSVGPFLVNIGANATITLSHLKAKIEAQAATLGVAVGGDANTITLSVAGSTGVIHAMNPAHIVYECCTNPEWGRGLDPSMMDENAAIYAANTFCEEGLGICLAWYRKEDIDVFIQKVCDLAAMVLYTDRETGLTVMRPIRDDYDEADLPLFTPTSGLIDVRDDDSATTDSSYNEIIGTGRDPLTNQEFQVRAQNLASFSAQQSAASLDQDYRGIPTKGLLSRLVLRDMQANASGLRKFTVVLDRRAWRIAPGMPFKISDPSRGINEIVLRAAEIDDGNMVNGQIVIKAAQDVFGLPSTSYMQPARPGWEPPDKTALPALEQQMLELSYRDLYLEAGEGNATSAQPTSAYIGVLAKAPSKFSYSYDLATKADGDPSYEVVTGGSFTGSAKLASSIDPLEMAVVFESIDGFDDTDVGDALLIGDELVRLESINLETGEATIARGCGDTIPQYHAAETVVWTIDDDLTSDGETYDVGDTVFAKVLTRTSTQALAVEDAPEMSKVMIGRQARPYPPGDVRVGGLTVYGSTGEQPEPELTWAPRNRLTQADQLVSHDEGPVLAEDGTTYNVRIFESDGATLLRTVTGIVGDSWTYDAAMQLADSPTSTVVMELESERDGITSYQYYRFSVALSAGWGYGWGYNYGG